MSTTMLLIHTNTHAAAPVIKTAGFSDFATVDFAAREGDATIRIFVQTIAQADAIAAGFRAAFPDRTIADLDPAGDHFHRRAYSVAKNTSNA